MRYVAIALVVGILGKYLSNLNKKQRAAHEADKSRTISNFTITQEGLSYKMIMWVGLFLTLGLMYGMHYQSMNEGGYDGFAIGLMSICAAAAIGLVVGLMSLYFWRVRVRGDNLWVRTWYMKETHYDIHEVTRITMKIMTSSMGEGNRFYVYVGKKKIFRIDENVDGDIFFERMNKEGVKVSRLS